MKKLLFIALVFAPLIQASITQEDAEAILNEKGINKVDSTESTFEQKAYSLTQFAKACAFDTSDMTLTFNWNGRTGYNSYSPRSINCSQLADVMEKMADSGKYASDMVDRLKNSVSTMRTSE